MKKLVSSVLVLCMTAAALAGCGNKSTETTKATEAAASTEEAVSTEAVSETQAAEGEAATVQVYIAASLSNAMDEISANYKSVQPNVDLVFNAGSSGKLQTQIEEGGACDVFFSAATKQMNALVEGGYVQEADVTDLLENKVQLIKPAGTETKVTGFENITDAANLALAADTVPVGQYAREIFDNLGITDQVMAMEINECEDVSAVLAAVSEGSNEVGIVYATDAASVADKVDVIATANDTELKSKVIYPVGLKQMMLKLQQLRLLLIISRHLKQQLYSKNMDFLASINMSPLLISLKTAIIATVVAFFGGIACARWAMKLKPLSKSILDGILNLPLVLPPTVAGFLLLLIFSLKRPLGIYLWEHYQLKVVLSWPGCVLAATVVAFPLMYRNARAAFEQVDVNYIYAGRTLGLSEWTIFRKVVIPVAGPGIASGTILTFARALGEYGATSMLAGNILGKTRTMAVAIAAEVSAQNYDVAGFWVIVLVTIAFVFIFAINIITMHGISKIQRW